MKCPKCKYENNSNGKFCSECGEKFEGIVIVKQAIPIWAMIILLMCFLTIGGLGYGFWDYFQDQKGSPIAYTETADSEQIKVQQVSSEEIVKKQENHAQQVDRVTLIKEVQQKVFTVVTSKGHGSGFLYKKGGYVITNAHVVEGNVEVAVRNSKGQESPATVIGISDHYDIALLHVPAYQDTTPLGVEKNESPVGLEVIAFGSPRDFENSASVGYITGNKRDMESEKFIYKQIYQIDAQVDQGSSGGPLVDVKTGNVIGINSLLYTSETSTNFGFSIPLYSMLEQFDAWVAQPLSTNDVLAVAGVYNYNPQPVETETDDVLAGQFVQSFRMYYEMALNEGDFYWIADMLAIDSSAYNELEDYVNDISGEGHYFSFTSNDILSVNYADGQYYVEMNETFDFYDTQNNYQYYDRYKTYTVTTDEYGAFKISKIDIH
ncbi:trypsin-like peptidase domain-containing protein [Lysinibacillus sp. NPDC097287]|uniref:trypsin-like peptidase domain-containing protein n=1 Tax=Lysinibacillus sp. NPDC097287 TaxID=3364144 RepID=UPI00381DCBE8